MPRGHRCSSLTFVMSSVISDLCYGPIASLEESYRVFVCVQVCVCVCVFVRDLETSKRVCLCPILVVVSGKEIMG